MKKILLLLLLLSSLTLSATGCNSLSSTSNNNSNQSNSSSGNKTCSHSWKSATCTEPKTCIYCYQTSGAKLGHTTETGICTRCGENFSNWKQGEYTDKFDQKTGVKYIGIDAYGTFSNSATTDSKLYAYIQIDNDSIGIMLWEYERNLVKGIFDYENYKISILDARGIEHTFTGTIYDGGTRIYFKDADRYKMINLLQNNATLKIHLATTKYTTSTYLFEIETRGFAEAYYAITN